MATWPPRCRHRVPGMGHSEGFVMRLEDRGGIGLAALTAARERLFEKARNNPTFAKVHSEALPDAPRIVLDVDRAKGLCAGRFVQQDRRRAREHLRLVVYRRLPVGRPYAPRGRWGRCVGGVVALDDRLDGPYALQRLAFTRRQRPPDQRHQFRRGNG